MMIGSHVVTGVMAWVVAAPLLGLDPLAPAGLALAASGSALPDIDSPKSWVGRRLWFISLPVSVILGHRGFTHSLLAIAAGLAAIWWWAGSIWAWVAAPLAVGYLAHLAGDLCTVGGVPLLWPSTKHCSLNLCRTGSLTELAIVGLLGATLWQVWQNG